MRLKYILLIFIILSLVAFAGCQKIEAQQKAVPQKAWDFTLQDIYGNRVSVSDFKGKVIILDFFATWCPPCRAEIPHFVELYDKYKDKGLVVIGISVELDQELVKRFAKEFDINYPVLIDDGKTSNAYGPIRAIPTTFIIDKDKNIVKKYIGYRDKETFEADILGLLR